MTILELESNCKGPNITVVTRIDVWYFILEANGLGEKFNMAHSSWVNECESKSSEMCDNCKPPFLGLSEVNVPEIQMGLPQRILLIVTSI